MKNACQEVKKFLKRANTALVTSHTDPDGDAIGSMLALGMVLEKQGLGVYLYNADSVPKIYRFLPGADRIKKELPYSQHFDIAFVIDASDLSRIGDKYDLRKVCSYIINVDHHPDNKMFGDLNCVSRCSSVAEHIFDLAKFLKVKIDKRMADCLYTSIITDTGNFRYDNTTAKTLQIAADLIEAGVNPHELTTQIYDTRSIPAVKIAGAALAGLKFSPDRQVAWTVVTEQMMKETGARGEDLNGIVDQIRSIEGIEVAIMLREDNDKVKINFRSKDSVNVSELARRFGGGGHFKAAGAAVEGVAIDKVAERVVEEVTKYLAARKYLA